MLSEKVMLLEGSDLKTLAKYLADEIREDILKEEKARKEKEPYLSTNKLAELFDYKPEFWRDKIKEKKLGKIDRNGYHMATYQEAYNFLFVNK